MADKNVMGFRAPGAVEIGTAHYYLDRLTDFRDRCSGSPPPSYYADYGNKCLHQFLETRPRLSSRGQHWVDDTLKVLQTMMEAERASDEVRFAELELDDEAFTEFAFGTHARAYHKAGVFELGARDLWKIVRTPDIADLLSDEGVREILKLMLRAGGGGQGLELGDAALERGLLGRIARLANRLRSLVVRP